MECLVRAMQYLSASKTSKPGEVVNIMGDSRLVIAFMNREFSPNKKALASGVNTCRELARKIPGKVNYYHVYRENNTIADYLSKLSMSHKFTGHLAAIQQWLQKHPDPKVPMELV